MQIVLYSDLDGTFLDHQSYSFQESWPALKLAQANGVPVVFCSSKTSAEMEAVRRETGTKDPFVVENGGAIYVPADFFKFKLGGSLKRDGFQIIELGTSYDVLVNALAQLAKELGLCIRGFHGMTAEAVAAECGLTLDQALLARLREYDEPFLLESASAEGLERLSVRARQLGLRVTRGGRFFHLAGDNDKGHAVRVLNDFFQRQRGEHHTVGLGDSLNDLPMLQAVDSPILVQRPDRSYDSDVVRELPGVCLADGVGPIGWNNAVAEILREKQGA